MSFRSNNQALLIAQSQVSDAFQAPPPVENGGLFSREECKTLAKYIYPITIEK